MKREEGKRDREREISTLPSSKDASARMDFLFSNFVDTGRLFYYYVIKRIRYFVNVIRGKREETRDFCFVGP